jgi:hypothetical protein
MVDALRAEGCRVIHQSPPTHAPFRITFETPAGERIGIVAYAFLATFTPTKNRPVDEHSFQVKYGSKDGKLHEVWQDPYGLYVTLFLGINPELGVFIGADPVLHSPTKFFIRVEFKQAHVDEILLRGWSAWERKRRSSEEPVEVLVGGTARSFLRYVRFERDVHGEDQGHRQLLAERLVVPAASIGSAPVTPSDAPSATRLHQLAHEFEMNEQEVLDLIARARRLKMAVRGWVAEEHLVRCLRRVPGITECDHLDEEGGPDIRLRYEHSRPITVECKNVLRQTTKEGLPRIDFQRTRASKGDPCSRYYGPEDFDVVAACLHAVTERWEFRYAVTDELDRFAMKCPGKLSNRVHVDQRWSRSVQDVLRSVVNR